MTTQHDSALIDLGDAVAETKGPAPIGTVDPVSGYRQLGGLSDED